MQLWSADLRLKSLPCLRGVQPRENPVFSCRSSRFTAPGRGYAPICLENRAPNNLLILVRGPGKVNLKNRTGRARSECLPARRHNMRRWAKQQTSKARGRNPPGRWPCDRPLDGGLRIPEGGGTVSYAQVHRASRRSLDRLHHRVEQVSRKITEQPLAWLAEPISPKSSIR